MLPSAPAVTAQMIATDSRLFADRNQLIEAIGVNGGTVLEIGVGYGDFSEHICRMLHPDQFIACDVFNFEHFEHALGQKTSDVFSGVPHVEYYRNRISPFVDKLSILTGDSATSLNGLPDHSCNLIYVDGAHHYDGVAADAAQAARLLTERGILIFNDYVRWDPFLNAEYGVVAAVNELLVTGDWLIVGFAFQRDMFCDIALRRKT